MKGPMDRFAEALDRAGRTEPLEGTACALATSDAAGQPSVRYVLLKDVDAHGFCFFTNFESRKARDLRENPRAALTFYWATVKEQVRIEGRVEPLSEAESDAYFRSRPRGRQLGAWASPQSCRLRDREELVSRMAEVTARFEGEPVPRPPFWGGYRLRPAQIEFWKEAPDRLHDRCLYTRVETGWKTELLAP